MIMNLNAFFSCPFLRKTNLFFVHIKVRHVLCSGMVVKSEVIEKKK